MKRRDGHPRPALRRPSSTRATTAPTSSTAPTTSTTHTVVRSEAVRASITAPPRRRSLVGTSSSARLRPTAIRIRSTIAPRTNPAPTAAVAVRAARARPVPSRGLTGTENLILLARLLGHSKPAARDRAAQLLEGFGLSEAAGKQVKNYSGGMRRRIDIAASILNTPDLLFLDEPTTGLDPRSRNQVWDIVRAVVAHGTTVLLTTQYLDEADQLASRIAVIDHGRVIAEGTKGELKASVGSGTVHLRLRDAAQRPEAERVLSLALDATVQLDADPVALTARIDAHGSDRGAAEQAARALAELARAGITVDNFSLGQPSLDEVFLALTDKKGVAA
ncbi:Vitamin B12 import ATP-binding protein BtuD [Streptomyces cyaneofuscatus]